MKALDELLLNTIDSFSFCLLREFQERKDKRYNQDTFDIIVNGKTSFEMERDLISGNLFGDILLGSNRIADMDPSNIRLKKDATRRGR